MPKQEELKQALAGIAEDNSTLQTVIDAILQGMQDAEAVLENLKKNSLIVSAAIQKISDEQNSLAETLHVGAGSGVSGVASAQSEALGPVSVLSTSESFADFAIAVISAWQGNSWGVIKPDPLEYGIFGFKGKRLQQVLDDYFSRSEEGAPQQPLGLAWYADKASDRHIRAAQLHVARDFLQAVIKLSIEPRGIRSPLGKLMIMDAAVDHGLTHGILKRAEVNLNLDVIKADGRYIKPFLPSFYDDEALYCQRFALERRKEREAQWADMPRHSQERLKARYAWFEKLSYERDMDFAAQADGVVHLRSLNIKLPLPKALLPNRGTLPEKAAVQRGSAGRLVYGSPVDPSARAVLPPGWRSAIDHGEIYQYSQFKGQTHTGLDINRSDDVDEGLPVYSVAEGLVVFAGVGAGAWGNLVVIRHPDGIWSRYGHLKRIAASIKKGAKCSRGALLGTIGRGQRQQFNAHLHFDMCKTALWAGNPSWWSASNPAEIEKHYVDPVAFITERGWWRR